MGGESTFLNRFCLIQLKYRKYHANVRYEGRRRAAGFAKPHVRLEFLGKGKGEIAFRKKQMDVRWELGKSKNDGKRSRRV